MNVPTANFPRVTIPGVEPRTEATDLFEAGKIAASSLLTARVRRRASLLATGKHIYRGTVTAKTKARRRKAARLAAASRKANR